MPKSERVQRRLRRKARLLLERVRIVADAVERELDVERFASCRAASRSPWITPFLSSFFSTLVLTKRAVGQRAASRNCPTATMSLHFASPMSADAMSISTSTRAVLQSSRSNWNQPSLTRRRPCGCEKLLVVGGEPDLRVHGIEAIDLGRGMRRRQPRTSAAIANERR